MKCQTFLLILSLSILFNSNLIAQWESLGDNIVPQNHRVLSIKVAPDKSVWAISNFDNFPPNNSYPKIHKSNDEGATWFTSELPAGFSTYGWDISPIDSNTAYVALDTFGLFQTVDGGLNWGKVTSYPSYRALFVHFFNDQEGLVYGNDEVARTISLTTDGGSSWVHMGGEDWLQPNGTSLPPFDSNEKAGFRFSLNSFYDYYEDIIMLGNSNGKYWISHDKGFNWQRRESPLTNLGISLSNIAIKDESTFMVAGDIEYETNTSVAAVNYTTTDGGNTWIEGNSGVTASASHYIPNSDSIFIMVGHNNFGWGSEGTAISYDYGENWEILDNTSIIAIDFLDENTGYGSCCNNIWQTANGQIHKWNFDLPTPTHDIVKTDLVKLMPNPVSSNLIVTTNKAFNSDKVTIEIIGINGQIIFNYQTPNNDQINIPVTDLPKGIYSLRITGDNKSIVKKFIKE